MTRRRRAGGYTLLEVMITLVIVGLATALLFEGVGGAARLSLRLGDEAARLDSQALAAEWWRTSLASSLPAEDKSETATLIGAAQTLTIETTMSLHARPGVPRVVTWRLTRDGDRTDLIYEPQGGAAWTVARTYAAGAKFSYLGRDERWLEAWTDPAPPRLVALEGFFDAPILAHPRVRFIPPQPPDRLDMRS